MDGTVDGTSDGTTDALQLLRRQYYALCPAYLLAVPGAGALASEAGHAALLALLADGPPAPPPPEREYARQFWRRVLPVLERGVAAGGGVEEVSRPHPLGLAFVPPSLCSHSMVLAAAAPAVPAVPAARGIALSDGARVAWTRCGTGPRRRGPSWDRRAREAQADTQVDERIYETVASLAVGAGDAGA